MVTVQYKTGRENPADYLSGHPTSTSTQQQRIAEAHNDITVQASVPKTLTLKGIEGATDGDHTFRAFRAAIKLNKWHYDMVKSFKRLKDGLRVTPKGTTTSY